VAEKKVPMRSDINANCPKCADVRGKIFYMTHPEKINAQGLICRSGIRQAFGHPASAGL
jgi:hypothetical protein